MKTRTLNASQLREEETDKQNSISELVKRTEVKQTPFTIITTNEGSFVTLNKYRISEYMTTEEECEDWCLDMNWNKLITVMMILQELKEVHNLLKE